MSQASSQIVNQFVLLARTIPHLAWTAWADGGVDFANDRWCAYTGLTQEQSMGKGWHIAIHADDLPELMAKWDEAIVGENELEGKMRIRCHDGNYRLHLVRATPIRDEYNKVIKWFGTNTDIHDFAPAVAAPKPVEERRRRAEDSEDLLAGRYRLLEKLGGGGNGNVHRGLHVQLEKTVAIKVINYNLHQDQEAVDNFKKEAKAAANINHPNIVNIIDFGIARGGIPFMVMDYIDGINLADYMAAHGPLDLGIFFEVFIQISDGLAAAHAMNIVHCDLKPGNVMIPAKEFEQNICKLVDFGFARFFSMAGDGLATGLQEREIVGSPPYMSPEQCTGEELDHRSDIYSVGCMMFEALAGRLPFEAYTVNDMLHKQVHETPVAISSYRALIPVELVSLIYQMLEKEKAARPASIQQVKKQLLQLYREYLERYF